MFWSKEKVAIPNNLKALANMTEDQLELLEQKIGEAEKNGYDKAWAQANSWLQMWTRLREILLSWLISIALLLLLLGGGVSIYRWANAPYPEEEVKELADPGNQWVLVGVALNGDKVWVREPVPGVECYNINKDSNYSKDLGCVAKKNKVE